MAKKVLEKDKKEAKIKGCKVKKCICNNDFQDSKYGYGNRVMNTYKEGYRCSSCGKEFKTS